MTDRYIYLDDTANGDLRIGEVNGVPGLYSPTGGLAFRADGLQPITFKNNSAERMHIDGEDGNVGIGMAPLRSTAKEQLETWKSQFDARLKAEPKADKKAVTLEITDDAFEVLPSEDKLAEWMETRGAGDKLQVGGNISASGTVSAGSSLYVNAPAGGTTKPRLRYTGVDISEDFCIRDDDAGVDRLKINKDGNATFSGNISAVHLDAPVWKNTGKNFGVSLSTVSLQPTDVGGSANHDAINIGSDANRFKYGYFSNTLFSKDASFSGVVNAGKLNSTFWIRSGENHGLALGTTGFFPVDGSGANNPGGLDAGSSGSPFNNAYFSGAVSAGVADTSTTDGGVTIGSESNGIVRINTPSGSSHEAFQIFRGPNKNIHFSALGNAYFSGTVDAGGFTVNGQPINAADVGAVSLTGDQTIDGSKTFKKSVQTESGRFFITSGDGGWRNLTWGGGWNMSDDTWIRSYGGKAIYCSNAGSSAIAAAGDVVAYYSDERLKDVKGQIENPLDKVDAIETFYYSHNDLAKELGYEGDELQVGVSAQSVKAVMPEVVCRAPVDMDADGGSLSGEDYLTVKYERLVPLLLESIKELRKEIEELKDAS